MKRTICTMLLILSTVITLSACGATGRMPQEAAVGEETHSEAEPADTEPETTASEPADNMAETTAPEPADSTAETTASEPADSAPETTAPEPADSAPETTASEPADSTAESASYLGTWTVKGCQAAEVSALSAEEMQDFLDDTVTYQADAVFHEGQQAALEEVRYVSEPYTEELLVENYQANLGEWWNGIGDISCISIPSTETFFGDQFFVADEETIWIYYEGVFFLAKKDGAQ